MINLLTNLILSALRLFNMVAFGALDSLAIVYSILVISTFWIVLKLDATIQICDLWRNSGKFVKALLLFGLLFNALPQWYLWILGIILIILAYFIKPKQDSEKSKKPSLFSKIKDVVMEEIDESDFKEKASNAISKTKEIAQKPLENLSESKKAAKNKVKKLPPV